MFSKIPQSVQDKSGAAHTAQNLADYADIGINQNEQLGGKTPLTSNVKELNKLVANDPSLKQYLSAPLQALMDYDGPTDAAKKMPDWENPQITDFSDHIEDDLRNAKDPTRGDMKKDIDSLNVIISANESLNEYLTPNVRALVKADKTE